MIDPGTQVRVERSHFRFGTDIWFWRADTPGRIGVYRFGDDGWIERAEDQNTIVEPSLFLPDHFITPLVAALLDTQPPNRATDRHLQDTIAVRDRLLTLVEKHNSGA